MIVAFKPGSAAAGRAAVAAAGGRVVLEIAGMDAVAAHVPAQALAGLSRNPMVEYIEEDALRYPTATTSPSGPPYAAGQLEPYGIRMVQADQLADAVASSRQICVIDSGFDLGHADLPAGAKVSGEYDTGTGWWYTDENSHGTHVAGTIAALNQQGVGVVGVLPNNQVRLHIVKVFDADGWAYSSTLVNAAEKCRLAGANVISMSLGGSLKSRTEDRKFSSLLAGNILSVAAAGNAGNQTMSYPASYPSVVSVAAIDENRAWATFSQYNREVDLAAPGVGVLSTVPRGSGLSASLAVGNASYAPVAMQGSPQATASGLLADFGLGGTASPGTMTGRVCLIQRGTYDFATKVMNCQNSGGVAAVIYNNVAGGFGGSLGGAVTGIPSVSVSDTEGAALTSQLGQSATVSVTAIDHAFFDGTSMATPHVSAVAALVWSHNANCTASQLRASLEKSALDLGPAGRDNKFGWGLVQAKAADTRIKSLGCGR